jgi:4a-hydroxytetrahydrobiopterin dehydratase
MQCVPCAGGVPRLSEPEAERLLGELSGWEVVEGHHLKKRHTFDDFRSALEFVNRAGAVAEREGHHPDICFGWGYVETLIWTHKIDGLTESDFVLAAKLDAAP